MRYPRPTRPRSRRSRSTAPGTAATTHVHLGTARDIAEFDAKNHWLIDRGDGRALGQPGRPQLRQPAAAAQPDHRRDDAQRRAARHDPGHRQLLHEPRHPRHALDRRHHLRRRLEPGAGAERDPARAQRRRRSQASSASASRSTTRRTRSPNLAGLQAFIDAYRSVHPVRRRPARPGGAADHRPGGRGPLADRRHTARPPPTGCAPTRPVLDYANAMVPARQPSAQRRADATGRSTSTASRSTRRRSRRWRRRSSPAACTSPRAAGPARVHQLRQLAAEADRRRSCRRVAPNGAGTHARACSATCSGPRSALDARRHTTPPNTCEGGVGAGATRYPFPSRCRRCASSNHVGR